MKELSALDTGKKPALKKRTGSSGFDRRPLTAFLAALAMYIFLGIVCRKYPFGDYSILISDLEAQYAPFLALYRGKLLSLGNGEGELISSLSYSFSMGLG
ncbi:MAG: YfhO family protein, partial [Clostridiales bacterium]|nr:YfhO family protein [Clostridiales bacterium]